MDLNESTAFDDFDGPMDSEESELFFASLDSSQPVDYNFMAEDEFITNLTVSNNREKPKETINNDCEFVSPAEIVLLMQDFSFQISDMLAVSSTSARLLLKHYNWKKEPLVDAYFEDEENVFKAVHVERQKFTGETSVDLCEICTDALPSTGSDACEHAFCDQCWATYLCTKIDDSIGVDTIPCPASKCNAYLDDNKVLKLIPSSKKSISDKYIRLISESFIEHQKNLNWCPGVNCTLIYKTTSTEPRSLMCENNHQFCSSCNQIWHDPITCALLKSWLNRSKDDLESVNWILEKTRPCPKCKVNIEKNHGCNHMTCKKCSHEFCWTCLDPVKHDHHCNRYVARTSMEAEQRFVSPERFEHFKKRYQNHVNSLMLEQVLIDNAEEKMKKMQDTLSLENAITRNQVLFYKKAVEILSRSREVLIATYVFAYFSKLCNELAIFEGNQQDLETSTEELSRYLEKNITVDNYEELKIKLQDKANYCEKRKRVLLEHVHEGLSKDWWHLEQ